MDVLGRFVLGLGFAMLALAVALGVNFSRFTGIYQSREPVLIERCEPAVFMPGAEDIVSVPGRGVLVSSVDRGRRAENWPAGIYWWPNDGDPSLVSTDAPRDFKPHGLSLVEDGNGWLLYAISHPGGLYAEEEQQHTVEVFRFDGEALSHLKTLAHPFFRSPNDLAVVREDVFYMTNDWKHVRGVMHEMEQVLAMPVSDVVLYDGGEARFVAEGLNYPNGIALSDDHETLYVNEIRGRRVQSFSVDGTTGDLERSRRYPIAAAPDNVTLAPDGHLLVAGIPEAFRFQRHAAGKEASAPSLILRIDPETGRRETIFYDESGKISGATVGTAHDEFLYIGTAYGAGVVRCPLS